MKEVLLRKKGMKKCFERKKKIHKKMKVRRLERKIVKGKTERNKSMYQSSLLLKNNKLQRKKKKEDEERKKNQKWNGGKVKKTTRERNSQKLGHPSIQCIFFISKCHQGKHWIH